MESCRFKPRSNLDEGARTQGMRSGADQGDQRSCQSFHHCLVAVGLRRINQWEKLFVRAELIL